MPAIWLLSTRGRPDACQEVLDACEATGMTSPGVVYVDETVDEYRGLRLPKNWTIHYEREWGSLGASMTWCYARYPNATQYGWLADDTVPETPGWDTYLEEAAGDWCLACARDLWLSEDPFSVSELELGNNLSSGLCWGGELVRTVGWWSLPGLTQAGIDTAWCALTATIGLGRYLHNVTVEHKNWRTGKRAKDSGDDWCRGGDDYVDRDIAARNAWVASAAFRTTLKRLVWAARVTPTEDQVQRIRQMLRDAYANEKWTPGGMSSARLQRVLEQVNAELDGLVNDIFNHHPHSGPF